MAEKMENIIQTSHLTKRYGAKIAVNDLNLSIRKGEVFGLLGPNGAGKTTTILMLLGLTEPTAGTAEIAALQKHGGPHAGSIMERHALDIRNEQLLHGAASVSSPRRSRVSY